MLGPDWLTFSVVFVVFLSGDLIGIRRWLFEVSVAVGFEASGMKAEHPDMTGG